MPSYKLILLSRLIHGDCTLQYESTTITQHYMSISRYHLWSLQAVKEVIYQTISTHINTMSTCVYHIKPMLHLYLNNVWIDLLQRHHLVVYRLSRQVDWMKDEWTFRYTCNAFFLILPYTKVSRTSGDFESFHAMWCKCPYNFYQYVSKASIL